MHEAERELLDLLRRMLPPGACEKVLPPLLAICRGQREHTDTLRGIDAVLDYDPYHGRQHDPDPYEWDDPHAYD